MSASVRTQYIIDILTKAWDQQNRLKVGLIRRRDLKARINAGEDCSGDPRYRFLVQSSTKVIEMLRDLAEQFDREHPDDQCSNLDIVDIMRVVELKFKG